MIVWLLLLAAYGVVNGGARRRDPSGPTEAREARDGEGTGGGKDPGPPLALPPAPSFELLRRADPDFEEQDFRDLVASLFVKVHRAIADQDLTRIRDFTDDRALQPLRARVEQAKRQGRVESFKDLRVEGIDLVSVTQDGPTQRVVLHIAASAASCVVDTASGRLVDPQENGDGVERRRFVESWTLAREAAVAAPQRHGHTCPSCGAPVAEGKRYICAYCGADLRGPDRQWTLLTFSPW